MPRAAGPLHQTLDRLAQLADSADVASGRLTPGCEADAAPHRHLVDLLWRAAQDAAVLIRVVSMQGGRSHDRDPVVSAAANALHGAASALQGQGTPSLNELQQAADAAASHGPPLLAAPLHLLHDDLRAFLCRCPQGQTSGG